MVVGRWQSCARVTEHSLVSWLSSHAHLRSMPVLARGWLAAGLCDPSGCGLGLWLRLLRWTHMVFPIADPGFLLGLRRSSEVK